MIRINLRATNSRRCTIANRKQKDVQFMTAREHIPAIKEKWVKSLGRLYKNGITDCRNKVDNYQQVQGGLRSIFKARMKEKFNVWCLKCSLYPRLLQCLTKNKVAAIRIE